MFAFGSSCYFPTLGSRFPFLCCAQNRPQSLPHNDFLPGLYGHGNQFDVVGLLGFFPVRIALANRGHQAWIVRAEHLDDRIVLAQLRTQSDVLKPQADWSQETLSVGKRFPSSGM